MNGGNAYSNVKIECCVLAFRNTERTIWGKSMRKSVLFNGTTRRFANVSPDSNNVRV